RAWNLPSAFCHISPVPTAGGGFDALREIYRGIQRGSLPETREFGLLLSNSGWLARAIWWRLFEGQLLAPRDAKYELHVVIEQKPATTNTISLSPDRIDVFGSPLAVIDWHVGDEDRAGFLAVYERFASMWRNSNLANMATLAPFLTRDVLSK